MRYIIRAFYMISIISLMIWLLRTNFPTICWKESSVIKPMRHCFLLEKIL